MAADIAFQLSLSQDHGSVELSTFDRIKARKRGETLEWFFAADVDPVLLALLREYEAHGLSPRDWHRSRFELATFILKLYFVLSPTDYARSLVVWEEALKVRYSATSSPMSMIMLIKGNRRCPERAYRWTPAEVRDPRVCTQIKGRFGVAMLALLDGTWSLN